mgnify:CR=1 FL=1|jgi:hypothetical protein
MSVTTKDLRNILEEYESHNCIMLKLDSDVIDYARKVANKVNDGIRMENVFNPSPKGLTDFYTVLRNMIDLQIDEDCCNDVPSVIGKYSKNLRLGLNNFQNLNFKLHRFSSKF